MTREDVKRLGLSHLLGTPVMRAYMHGFFVDQRLYHKAKSLSDPFAYDRYRQNVVREKLEEERRSRIAVAKKAPKINARLATKLMDERDGGAEEDLGETERPKSLLDDDRFASLFKDERFKIDEESEEYRLLHPNAPPSKKKPRFAAEDGSEEEEESEEELLPEPKMRYGRKHDDIAEVPLGQRLDSGGDGDGQRRKVTGSRELTWTPERRRGSQETGVDASGSGKKRRRRKMKV